MHACSRRRILRMGALAAATAALTACAAFVPRSVEVLKEKLQAGLSRRFPITRKLGEGLDLTVEAPRLDLLLESNRFALECPVGGAERLLGRPLAGVLALSSGLVFDPATNTVRASDVRVERLHVDGLPTAFERTLERLVRPLAAAWLEQQPIYVLGERDIERLRSAGVKPGDIRITATGISIELVPR